MSGTYKDLKVWQSAMELVEPSIGSRCCFPGMNVRPDFSNRKSVRFSGEQHCGGQGPLFRERIDALLSFAKGSLFEVETQITIASRLNYLDRAKAAETAEVGRLLNGLMKAFRSSPAA